MALPLTQKPLHLALVPKSGKRFRAPKAPAPPSPLRVQEVTAAVAATVAVVERLARAVMEKDDIAAYALCGRAVAEARAAHFATAALSAT